jgi:pimeloyl-ACP methyl ester carboxylesterase
MRLHCKAVLLLLFLTVLCSGTSGAELPAGPVQTLLGPGGRLYKHEGFSHWENGKAQDRYHVFTPSGPVPARAGFVVLLHDWFSADPGFYSGLIRHLTRQGWIVVFPLYQGTGSPDKVWHINVARSVKDFLLQQFARKEITVDNAGFMIIGHGAGAVMAANLAATCDYFDLPRPAGLMIVTPHRRSLKLLDLSGISREARMLVITGDAVEESNEAAAREIFYAADRVRSDNKAFVTVLSDYYGQPPLVADELAALSPEKPEFERLVVQRRHEFVNLFREKFHAPTLRTVHIDAYDWFVVFRLFDALGETIFAGNTTLDVFKNSPELRFMGYWSDGKKLKGIIITDRP